MTLAENLSWFPIEDFTAPQQILLFQQFKQSQSSGQLLLEDETGRTWRFYIYLGRIVYATGGEHAVRRWRRNLTLHMPQMADALSTLKEDLAAIAVEDLHECWEYQLLCLWVKQEKVTREQAVRMVRAVVIEVLFDVTQVGSIIYQLKTDHSASTALVLINAEQVVSEAWKSWNAWRIAKLSNLSPNSVPSIRNFEQLQSRTSATTYQALVKSLNGNRSLRDLAVKLKQDIITLTRLLMPYIHSELIEFVTVPDLPSPVAQTEPEAEAVVLNKGTVALIDDNPYFCQELEKVFTSAGYQFVSVNAPLEAVAILFSRQPDLIFLNLNMPHTNGYEMCSEFRKLNYFRQTPIVLVTNNVNIGDRVKAKMVGCSGFLSKSVDHKEWVSFAAKHLNKDDREV